MDLHDTPIIGRDDDLDMVVRPVIDGEAKGKGYVPRDFNLYPQEMFDPPSQMTLVPRVEWGERVRELNAKGMSLSAVRNRGNNGQPIPSLDQNGQGFCWAYSVTHCVTLLRAVANLPYVRLSAHAVGCKIKNFRDEGGWCGLSADFYRKHGCPTTEFWPEKSMGRQYDRPETWANAAEHKILEDWADLTRAVQSQNLTFDQVVSSLLTGTPCAIDLGWWAHSVCAMDVVDGMSQWGVTRSESGKALPVDEFDKFWGVDTYAGGFGVLIWNSWTDQWGNNGTAVITGDKAIPQGAVAPRSTGGIMV